MKTVTSLISPEDHSALRERANRDRRSLGAQLAYEAFCFVGIQAPDYIAKPATKRPAKKGAKSK